MKINFTIVLIIAFLFPTTLSAQPPDPCDPSIGPLPPECNATGNTGGGSTGNSGGRTGNNTSSTVTLQNPIGENDPRVILGNILRVVLGLVGSIALVVFVFGGLTWMTSAGNSDRVTQGRDTLIWAAIGLIVIFASYTLVAFILQTITGA